MDYLSGKQVLLGVTGGIAAYKSAELVRRLREQGATVRVVMTQGAQAFITPLTLQALSGQPVHSRLLDEAAESAMGHIELARWADVVLVAPEVHWNTGNVGRTCTSRLPPLGPLWVPRREAILAGATHDRRGRVARPRSGAAGIP